MNYLPFAIIAQLLNSVAVTIDKFLLSKAIPDPLVYIFYFSLVSLLALVAIPFVPAPPLAVITIASISTLCWTFAAYLMFKALKSGQVQRVIPVIGALTPLFLLVSTNYTNPLSQNQIMAVITLIAGLVFLTLQDLKGKFDKSEIMLEVLSALFFAFSYHFLKLSFDMAGFLTVLVWSRPVLVPLALAFLLIPNLRRKSIFFTHSKSAYPFLFIIGQICAGISELLLVFSISLASPAIVNSLQGIKYVFLLIFSLLLGYKFPAIFKPNFSGWNLIYQIVGIILIGIGLYLLASGAGG